MIKKLIAFTQSRESLWEWLSLVPEIRMRDLEPTVTAKNALMTYWISYSLKHMQDLRTCILDAKAHAHTRTHTRKRNIKYMI